MTMPKLAVTGRMAEQLDGMEINTSRGRIGIALVKLDGGTVSYKAAYVVQLFRDGRNVANAPRMDREDGKLDPRDTIRTDDETKARAAYIATVARLTAEMGGK